MAKAAASTAPYLVILLITLKSQSSKTLTVFVLHSLLFNYSLLYVPPPAAFRRAGSGGLIPPLERDATSVAPSP